MTDYVDDAARPFEQAVQFSMIQLNDLRNVFGCELEQIDELNFTDLFLSLSPEIETHISQDETRVWHTIPEALAKNLVGFAADNRLAYEVCCEISSRNSFNGAALPFSLRCFVAQVLVENFPAPKKSSGNPDNSFPSKWVLSQLARTCETAFELRLTRNDAAPAHSACDAVVEALERRGGRFVTTHESLRDWCHHRKYGKARSKMAALQHMLSDEAVRQLELIRPA